MIERIFDIVAQRGQEAPGAIMLSGKENGAWRSYTCGEVWETADQLAGGLQALGISKDLDDAERMEKIAIISANRPEWIMTDIGVQLAGAVLTPIYPTISPTELEYIFSEAGVQIVFVQGANLYNRFMDAFAALPALQHVYSFDAVEGVAHWKALCQKGRTADLAVKGRIRPETLATIIYTSGTTGEPKGVMLSHRNIVSNVLDSTNCFTFAKEGSKALSFLPLNHVFERMVTYVYLHSKLNIYYAESMDTIGANLKEVKPMVFTTVPRLLEKVYERIMATGMELTGFKKALFFWALDLGFKYDNVVPGSLWYRMQLWLANELVYSKWRAALGNSVKAIVVGSAACQERLGRIFSAARVVIMEGYGLTETSPVVCVNRFESENRRIGTVGPLIDNVSVKLAEDGEIWVKGQNVMMGYYKHPDMYAATMEGDWFKTGDIGKWVEDRFLKITDRKKEIFKTSGGKYVAPQAIENKMKECPYIEQMMVTGNGRKFVGALIVPGFAHLRKYFQENKPDVQLPEDNAAVIEIAAVKDFMMQQVESMNPLFSHPEQVKKIQLLYKEWTIDSGELTPSLKIKRKVIEERYSKQIDRLYDDL